MTSIMGSLTTPAMLPFGLPRDYIQLRGTLIKGQAKGGVIGVVEGKPMIGCGFCSHAR